MGIPTIRLSKARTTERVCDIVNPGNGAMLHASWSWFHGAMVPGRISAPPRGPHLGLPEGAPVARATLRLCLRPAHILLLCLI